MISGIVSLVICVFGIAGMWRIFERVGEKGWKAIIPIYNTYTFAKNAGNGATKDFWFSLLGALIEGVGYVLMKPVATTEAGTAAVEPTTLSIVLLAIGVVVTIIFTFRVFKKFFAKYDVGAIWAVLMTIFPIIPEIYFGFFDKQTASFNRLSA